MEEYLTVTAENVDDLTELGLPVAVDDELECEVECRINGSDKSVGIMSASAQVFGITYKGVDVTRFFDLDDVEASILRDHEDRYQDALVAAADARFEQIREYDAQMQEEW